MGSVEAELSGVLGGPAEGRVAGLKTLIDECIHRVDSEGLVAVVQRAVEMEASPSQAVVGYFAARAPQLAKKAEKEGEAFEEAGMAALRVMGGASAFEDSDASLRHALFDYYVETGAFGDGARVLAGLAVEGRARYSDAAKAELYVKIAETFLEDDESVDAEAFVSRASNLMHSVARTNWALHLRYRVTLARTLDARRKFLEAAVSYYELSQARHQQISADDLLALLAKAITCAILGPAGPQRARILATLYKDERVLSAMASSSTEFAARAVVLSKMCTSQLVYKKDIAAFESTLLPHHRAVLPDGLTIPERATIQHNLIALAHVYSNVDFDQLGALLGINASKALHLATRMIADNRLHASIDQIDSFLVFHQPLSNLQHFDDDINDLCSQVNSAYDKIESAHKAPVRVNTLDPG